MKYNPALYQSAWDAMDACNGSGLIMSFPKLAALVWEELRSGPDAGTDAFNRHPVVIMMADKLLQLAGIHSSDSGIQEAYGEVNARLDVIANAIRKEG